MYTKEEASLIREKFWKAFGQYMSYVPSADGRERINWINYKTGYKYVQFKTHADKKQASIALVFSHPDEAVQELMMEQLKSLKTMLPSVFLDDWNWLLHQENEYYKIESKVELKITQVNIFNDQTWPDLISFFKKNLILLDEIWNETQFAFEEYKFM